MNMRSFLAASLQLYPFHGRVFQVLEAVWRDKRFLSNALFLNLERTSYRSKYSASVLLLRPQKITGEY